MESYDTMTMGYMPDPIPVNGLQNLDYMSAASGLDLQDQYSNFESETFVRLVQHDPLETWNLLLTVA